MYYILYYITLKLEKKETKKVTKQGPHIYFSPFCKCVKPCRMHRFNSISNLWGNSLNFLLNQPQHLWKPFPVCMSCCWSFRNIDLFVLILWKTVKFYTCSGLFLPVFYWMAACPGLLEQRLLGGRERQTLLFEVVDD